MPNAPSLPTPDDLFMEAVNAALRIPEPADVANSLLQIIGSLLEVDNTDYARALLPKTLLRIRELDDPKEFAYLLRLFVKLQCEMGCVVDAIDSLPLFDEETEQRGYALKEIAIAQAKAGQLADALTTSDGIEDLDDFEAVLEAVGEQQIRRRLFNDVVATAAKIEEAEPRARLLQNLALAQWDLGNADDALTTMRNSLSIARGIADETVRNRALSDSAIALTKIQRVFDALTVSKEITEPLTQIAAYCSIIVSLKDGGNHTGGRTAAGEAATAARRLHDPFHRAAALRQVGEALQRIGDVAEARAVFKETLAAIREIRNSYSQTMTLMEFAARLAGLGNDDVAVKIFRLAVALAQTIDGYPFQLLCLCKTTEAQANASLCDEAVQTLDIVEELRETVSVRELETGAFDRDWAAVLAVVAASIPDKDEAIAMFKRSVGVAEKIGDPNNRTFALRNVAVSLSKFVNHFPEHEA